MNERRPLGKMAVSKLQALCINEQEEGGTATGAAAPAVITSRQTLSRQLLLDVMVHKNVKRAHVSVNIWLPNGKLSYFFLENDFMTQSNPMGFFPLCTYSAGLRPGTRYHFRTSSSHKCTSHCLDSGNRVLRKAKNVLFQQHFYLSRPGNGMIQCAWWLPKKCIVTQMLTEELGP